MCISHCKHSCFGIWQTLGKHFFFILKILEVFFFFGKTCSLSWRSDIWLVRGQVNMVDKARLHICSIYSVYFLFSLLKTVAETSVYLSNFCLRKHWGREQGPRRILRDFAVRLYLLSNGRSYIHKLSTMWLPKHELRKNGISGHAKAYGETEGSWGRGRVVFPRVHQLIIQYQMVSLKNICTNTLYGLIRVYLGTYLVLYTYSICTYTYICMQ